MSEPPAPEPEIPPEVRRATSRLAARSRELDVLQSLGRRATATRAPEELFAAVIDAVHREDPLDLALVGYTWHDVPGLLLFTARPFEDRHLRSAARRVLDALSWSTDADIDLRAHRLDGFDEARGGRSELEDDDGVLLPVVAGSRRVACVLAIPAAAPDERRLRMLYNASNQLSLHFERIVRAQEAEADRHRAIVEAMPQGVLLTDGALRILLANRAAEKMLGEAGVSGSESFAATLERLGLVSAVESVRDRSRPVAEKETRVDGDRIWSVTVSAMPSGAGARDGLVFVLSDRTESHRLQQQLAHAETMSSLGHMISGVAHELNNPLASIVGYAQLIGGATGGDEKLARRLHVMGREAERCRKIVQNLLSFARRREPERTLLSLNQVVESVVGLLGYQLRVDGVRVECELDPSLPAIEGDAHQLEQVLVNLLTNAAHAIHENGETGSVTIVTRGADDGGVVLEIRDTGPGIPEQTRARIFDPFFTTKRPGEGTGLGLSLAHGIVTDHGGTIEVLAHDAPGTTFRITLPPGRAGAPAPAEPAAERSEGTRAESAPLAGRILVIDDDEQVARMICEALVKDGLSTERVRGGREALERLSSASFDGIVCDVKMPDMNGERLYEELSRSRPTLARAMLWTTGDTLGSMPEDLARRTGLDVLVKPFDLHELRVRVRRLLAR